MKTLLLTLTLALTGLELWAQTPAAPGQTPPPNRPIRRFGNTNGPATQPLFPAPNTPGALPANPALGAPNFPPAAGAVAGSTSAANAQPEETIPAGMIDFEGVDVNQVLEVYSKLLNRTLLRGNLPAAQIVLKTRTDLTKTEAIEALQAVLALNNISVINVGEKFIKAVQSDQANSVGAPLDRSGSTDLPELGTYVTHITQLKYVKPSVMQQVITPFSRLPNAVFPIDDNGILVIRDYAENVKRMLEMIDQIDVSVPAEYTNEVIPIRYAKVDDIASALNSLGGSGGATVSIGGSTAAAPINGLRGSTSGINGMGNMGGANGLGGAGGVGGGTLGGQNRTLGGTSTTPNGTPTSGSTFAQRLNNIINQANGTGRPGSGGSGQDQIVLFGQTKIIPNESSSSLLIYATRQDMATIKDIISKLDVLLAQVLIESIIMDVGLGNEVNMGVSAVQQPQQFNNSKVTGGGAMINGGSSFLNTLQNVATNGATTFSSSLPTNALSGGLSYFANIGDTWNILVTAAESDSKSSIIQRPRIQTSQSKPAQFFVGQTVPYVNNTYNNYTTGGYGGSSYSQLSVGVELDVTPFINPDGIVDMVIAQEIDEISGYTSIDGNNVPNTVKRTLNSEIAVKNRDTVILGGFVEADKSHTRSGVPILMDIPILGRLFTSNDDKKNRSELIVLIRPTVLEPPSIAANQTILEARRLPGVSAAAAEDAADTRKLIETERQKELKAAKSGKPADGFFNMKTGMDDTNEPAGDFGSAPGTKASSAPKTQRRANNPLRPTIPPADGTYSPAPGDSSEQAKARAALIEKMSNTNSPAEQ